MLAQLRNDDRGAAEHGHREHEVRGDHGPDAGADRAENAEGHRTVRVMNGRKSSLAGSGMANGS